MGETLLPSVGQAFLPVSAPCTHGGEFGRMSTSARDRQECLSYQLRWSEGDRQECLSYRLRVEMALRRGCTCDWLQRISSSDMSIELPYLTASFPGIGGSLKQRAEDFFVQEIPLYEPGGVGEHVYCEIQKVNL